MSLYNSVSILFHNVENIDKYNSPLKVLWRPREFNSAKGSTNLCVKRGENQEHVCTRVYMPEGYMKGRKWAGG